MRSFDYSRLPDELLDSDIVRTLREIHGLHGRLDVLMEINKGSLWAMSKAVRIQSVDASNRIEGIRTTNRRLAALMQNKVEPRNRSEAEIAGYRDVLSLVHDCFLVVEPTPPHILQLHRELYQYDLSERIGVWKLSDNVVAERTSGARVALRFIPLEAAGTASAIEAICAQYKEVSGGGLHDPLILMCLFIFDFTCIHPFADGNGRMSRLLTLLLMNRSGYDVGRYASIEKLIYQSRRTYYEALQASSTGWHEGTNDYRPFVRYMLGVVLAAYRDLSSRADEQWATKQSKADRVEEMLARYQVPVRKRDILERYPDISETTVERTLAELLQRGAISKIGAGPATAYISRTDDN